MAPNEDHSEGTTDEIELYAVPYGEDWENKTGNRDIFKRALDRMHPDLIFVQMDPSNFIARQRFLAHKSALKGVEDYELKGIHSMNPETPQSWEETVVNLVNFSNQDSS